MVSAQVIERSWFKEGSCVCKKSGRTEKGLRIAKKSLYTRNGEGGIQEQTPKRASGKDQEAELTGKSPCVACVEAGETRS